MSEEQNTEYERLKQAAASVWFAGNMYIGPSMTQLMQFLTEYKRLAPEYEQDANQTRNSVHISIDKQAHVTTVEPDAYCYTLEDGSCVSTDPRCMHNAASAAKKRTIK